MQTNEEEKIKFQIDQRRKDKIIYAVEASATSLVCIIGYSFSNQYFVGSVKDFINILLLLIAVGYTLFMGIGNFKRLKKIKELEKLISAQN